MRNNIEIEIQVSIENSQKLLDFLNENAEFKGEKHQIDEYFTPFHRDFLGVRPAVEWLRLRDGNGLFSVTYKNWHADKEGKTQYADEYETKIDNLEQLRKIFIAIDIKPLITVDKIRKIWVYNDYEIALDCVKDLGDFVEIEHFGEAGDKSPEQITSEMVQFLKDIGCGEIKRNYVGYPFLILFPNEVKYDIL